MDLRDKVRSIKDFPKEGIIFRDVTTIFKDPQAFHQLMDEMAATLEGQKIDVVIGPEARGFTVASVLAYMLHAGFVPVRKPGKLPAETLSYSYDLEYGSDTARHEGGGRGRSAGHRRHGLCGLQAGGAAGRRGGRGALCH